MATTAKCYLVEQLIIAQERKIVSACALQAASQAKQCPNLQNYEFCCQNFEESMPLTPESSTWHSLNHFLPYSIASLFVCRPIYESSPLLFYLYCFSKNVRIFMFCGRTPNNSTKRTVFSSKMLRNMVLRT